MIIDEYIDRINEAINDGDETKQNALLEEVFRVFEKDIPDIQKGTTHLQSRMNAVFNLNDLDNPSTDV